MATHVRSKSFRSEAFGFARAAIGVSLGVAALFIVIAIGGSLAEEALFPGTVSFDLAYARVSPGMHRDEVVQSLGEPSNETTAFYLGQREGFEAEYEAAAASASDYFLVWNRGIDTVYSIGLTEDHRVAFKAAGGT